MRVEVGVGCRRVVWLVLVGTEFWKRGSGGIQHPPGRWHREFWIRTAEREDEMVGDQRKDAGLKVKLRQSFMRLAGLMEMVEKCCRCVCAQRWGVGRRGMGAVCSPEKIMPQRGERSGESEGGN